MPWGTWNNLASTAAPGPSSRSCVMRLWPSAKSRRPGAVDDPWWPTVFGSGSRHSSGSTSRKRRSAWMGHDGSQEMERKRGPQILKASESLWKRLKATNCKAYSGLHFQNHIPRIVRSSGRTVSTPPHSLHDTTATSELLLPRRWSPRPKAE